MLIAGGSLLALLLLAAAQNSINLTLQGAATFGTSTDMDHIQFVGDRDYYPVYRLHDSNRPEWGLGCFDVTSVNPTQPGPCHGQNGRDLVGINGFIRMGPRNTSLTHGSSDFLHRAGRAVDNQRAHLYL